MSGRLETLDSGDDILNAHIIFDTDQHGRQRVVYMMNSGGVYLKPILFPVDPEREFAAVRKSLYIFGHYIAGLVFDPIIERLVIDVAVRAPEIRIVSV